MWAVIATLWPSCRCAFRVENSIFDFHQKIVYCVELHACECELAIYCSPICKEQHAPKHARHCVMHVKQALKDQSEAARARLRQEQARAAVERAEWAAATKLRMEEEEQRRSHKARVQLEEADRATKGAVLLAWRKMTNSQIKARASVAERMQKVVELV